MSAYDVATLINSPQMQCSIFFQNFMPLMQIALVVFQLSVKMDGEILQAMGKEEEKQKGGPLSPCKGTQRLHIAQL